MISTQAITSLRKSDLSSNIAVRKSEIFDKICAGNLTAVSGLASSISARSVLDLKFSSVKTTTDDCKDIGQYQLELKESENEILDLPDWTPTASCVDHSKFGLTKFNWFDFTEPKYPFRIMLDNRPEPTCCQDDFFYCPSVNNTPCPIEGDIEAPETTVDVSDDCTKDCGVEFELQNGGLEFPPLPVDGVSSETCVIRGVTDHYIQKAIVEGPLSLQISTALLGDGACPFRVTITADTVSGTVEISPGNLFWMDGGETTELTLDGDGIVELNISVNDENLGCCEEYSITITSESAADPEEDPTEATSPPISTPPISTPISEPPISDPVIPPTDDPPVDIPGDPPLDGGGEVGEVLETTMAEAISI